MQCLIVCVPWSIAFLHTFFFSLSVSRGACVLCTRYVHILDRHGERRWWFPQKKKPRTVNATAFLSPVPPAKALRLGHFLLGAGLGSSLRRLSHWGGHCLDPAQMMSNIKNKRTISMVQYRPTGKHLSLCTRKRLVFSLRLKLKVSCK